MKQLKITKENFDLLVSGVKTKELRALEDLGDGGEFMLVDSITGQVLALIKLKFLGCVVLGSHNSLASQFYGDMSVNGFNVLKDGNRFCYYNDESLTRLLAKDSFWRPWVDMYLAKGETPAFYQVLALEVK